MRLDKWLTKTIGLTRSEAKKVIRGGRVQVSGEVIKDGSFIIDNSIHKVEFGGQVIEPVDETLYLLLNKPLGFECTLKSKHYPTVLELIDLPNLNEVRIAGRLDVDTTGALLLSTDGQWLHFVTSPRRVCPKLYEVTLFEPMSEAQQADAIDEVARGIYLDSEELPTLPAKLEFTSPTTCELTLTEGKYHQVKRMFAALGNHVTALHRSKIGDLDLSGLELGDTRFLTSDEIASFMP